jgi:hypothetical protein
VVEQDVLQLGQAQQLVQGQLLPAATQVEQHGIKRVISGGKDLGQPAIRRSSSSSSSVSTCTAAVKETPSDVSNQPVGLLSHSNIACAAELPSASQGSRCMQQQMHSLCMGQRQARQQGVVPGVQQGVVGEGEQRWPVRLQTTRAGRSRTAALAAWGRCSWGHWQRSGPGPGRQPAATKVAAAETRSADEVCWRKSRMFLLLLAAPGFSGVPASACTDILNIAVYESIPW